MTPSFHLSLIIQCFSLINSVYRSIELFDWTFFVKRAFLLLSLHHQQETNIAFLCY